MNIAEQIREKIGALSEALISAHPRMPILLKEIHDHLRRDPELVTLISEEEIQVIVNGLKKQTQVDLVTTAVKVGGRGGKSLKNITTDML